DAEQAAVRARTGRLRRTALDDNRPGHHVLGDTDTAVAAHADGRELVHARAVVADVAVDLDVERSVEADRDRMATVRVREPDAHRVDGAGKCVQRTVDPADGVSGDVERQLGRGVHV